MDVALIVLLPFLGACIPPLTARSGRNVCAGATAAVTFAALLLLLARAPAVFSGETVVWGVPWVPQIGLSFSFFIDALGLFFAALILGIGLLIILYARFYLSREDPIGKFYAYLLLFQGAMVGIVLSDNLLLLIVFWELTSLTSFLLIGYWRHLPQARQGARMALLVTGGGGLALIGGMLILGQIAGSYQLSEVLARGDIVKASPLYVPALLLILLAAFTKSAQFPFHFWLPHAMSAPTPVSAYLHSATMVKAGVFLLARLWPVLAGTADVVSDRCAGRPRDHADRGLDRAVQGRSEGDPGLFDGQPAWHDDDAARLRHGGGGRRGGVSHPQSRDVQGGAVHERRRDRSRSRHPPYPPARRSSTLMPIIATLSFVAAAAMAGIPLSNGFLSKEMMLEEASHTAYLGRGWLFPVLATAAALLSAAYSSVSRSARFSVRRGTIIRIIRTIRLPACGCRLRCWFCRSSRSGSCRRRSPARSSNAPRGRWSAAHRHRSSRRCGTVSPKRWR